MLGGGESKNFMELKKAAEPMHRSLFVGRQLRKFHADIMRTVIDLGSDQRNNLLDEAKGPQLAIESLRAHAQLLRQYPSCFGDNEVRTTIQKFMKERFNVLLDRDTQVCLTQGTTHAFESVAQTFAGAYVVLPRFSIFTVAQAATANGAECVRAPYCEKTGFFHIDGLERLLDDLRPSGIRFIYLNSPSNPEGRIARPEYLENLVKLANQKEALILHDMDCWGMRKDSTSRNILGIQGGLDCSVTAITPSKELGLPGLRVGFLAGNAQVITRVQRNNEWRGVMIPGVTQASFSAALASGCRGELEDNFEQKQALELSFEGWRKLGWSESAIHKPEAGYKYLVDLPPSVKDAELLEFEIFARTGVKLSTTFPFNPEEKNQQLRVVVSEKPELISEAFKRMHEAGISYGMTLRDDISTTYKSFTDMDAFIKI